MSISPFLAMPNPIYTTTIRCDFLPFPLADWLWFLYSLIPRTESFSRRIDIPYRSARNREDRKYRFLPFSRHSSQYPVCLNFESFCSTLPEFTEIPSRDTTCPRYLSLTLFFFTIFIPQHSSRVRLQGTFNIIPGLPLMCLLLHWGLASKYPKDA